MRLLKRVILVILLIAVAAATWFGIQITRHRADESVSLLDAWVAGQVEGVANRYLQPKFTMESFTFRLPGTFTARNMRMTAPDPANPGTPIDIIEAGALIIELDEVPREGKPIRIRKVTLDAATVRLVSISATDRSLVGFSELVRPTPDVPSGDDAKTTTLSEVLRIERVELTNGTIFRDSRLPGLRPMELSQIDTKLDITSRTGGAYSFDTTLTQGTIFESSVAGSLDIDEMTLQLKKFDMETTINDTTLGYLPPTVQSWVKEYQIRGHAKLSGHGTLGSSVPTAIQSQLSMTDTNFATGSLQFPMKTFDARLTFDDENLTVRNATASMLGGTVQAQGTVGLLRTGSLDLACRLQDIHLEDMITAFAEDPTIEPAYRGRVRADATWKTPYNAILTETSGTGRIRIDHGTLSRLPVIDVLTNTAVGMAKVAQIDLKPSDTASSNFEFQGDHVRLTDTRIATDLMAVRGRGVLGYDGRIDAVANGGPLEKVQSMLGGVGDLFSKISDSLAHYTITGPVSDSQVNMSLGPAPKVVKE